MREELESHNDSVLPDLLLIFDEIDNSCRKLYKAVKEIPETEQIGFVEFQQEMLKVDRSNIKYFLILYASLLISNYNKRQVMTKIGLYNIFVKASKKQISFYNSHFEGVVQKVFEFDILKKNVTIKYSELFKLLDYRLKNVHYSDRIWKNMSSLNDRLFGIFTEGLSKKYSIFQMANLLNDLTDVGYAASVRLIKTELTAVISLSLLDYYKKSGITRVQQISTLDNRTSEICELRHLAIIDIATAVVGENIPPLHPYCRSIIIPLNE